MSNNKGKGQPIPPRGMINVPMQGIQDMQRGYEMRIARQRDSIDRLVKLLDLRTEQFTQFCRDQVEQAAHVPETDQAPVLAVAGGGVIDDTELDPLLLMIPKEWDMIGEDDTARSILTAYINYLHDHISRLEQSLKTRTQELDLARADAQNNARQANRAMAQQAAVDADDTPPWMKDEPQAFVQPATIGASGVFTNEPPPEITETLDWSGAKELPQGEQRPGSF